MPDRDLELLISAAKASGEIASGFAIEQLRSWHKPDDAGPVTEADIAVNTYLEETLRGARPDYGWLSEETEDNTDRLTAEKLFVIDPIDGTRSFMEGSYTWAHSLSVVTHGEVTAAVVYLPMKNRLYSAAKGLGAHLNNAPIRSSNAARLEGASVLLARPALDPRHWKSGPPSIERNFRPSLAYRLALVAEGRFDAMLTLRRSWEWDIAAGALIISEAGGAVSDRTGAPLRFNNAEPLLSGVVASGAEMHADIHAHLA